MTAAQTKPPPPTLARTRPIAAAPDAARHGAAFGLHITLAIISVVWLLPTVVAARQLVPPGGRDQHDRLVDGVHPAVRVHDGELLRGADRNNMGTSFLNSLIISIPATVIPIMIAAFAAYAFAWMNFPGRDILFVLVVGLLVVPLQAALIPVLQFSVDVWGSSARSRRSGWPTPASGCRSRSSCCATSSAPCLARCSSRPPSTARRRRRPSSGWPCRWPSRRSRRS